MPTTDLDPKSTAPRPKKKTSLERVMLMLTLFFIVGVLLLTLLPEDGAYPAVRGIVMALYCMGVFWVMFRFGV